MIFHSYINKCTFLTRLDTNFHRTDDTEREIPEHHNISEYHKYT